MVYRSKTKKRSINGTSERPRLYIYRSLKYIYAQIIDDIEGKTLAAVSSKKFELGRNIKSAEKVGKEIAQQAKAKGITKIVFDRGNNLYHGSVKVLADSAREGGLKF